MGQSNKPAPLSWATDVAADIVVPPAGKILLGWLGLDIPPNSWVNWFWNLAALWIAYVAGIFGVGSDSWVITGLEVKQLLVPTNSQVEIQVGLGIAGQTEVELIAVEVHNIAVVAGTAAPGALQATHMVIDATGTITPVLLAGTFPDRDAALRTVLQGGANDEGTLRTSLGLVINEDGAPLYDAAQMVDTRQLAPVSSSIVAQSGLRQTDLIDPALIWAMDQLSKDETVLKETRFDLDVTDISVPLAVFADAGRMNRQEQVVTVKAFVLEGLSTPGDYGSSGLAFRRVKPFSDPPAGNPDDVAITVTEDVPSVGFATVFTSNGDQGGMNHWSGKLIVSRDHRVIFSRRAGLASVTVLVEISNAHGATITQVFDFRAT